MQKDHSPQPSRATSPLTSSQDASADGCTLLAGLLHAHPQTAFDYLEFRRLLGAQSAAFAAERATPEALERVRQCLEAVQAAHALDDPAQEAAADADFHLAIYEAAGNVVILHIMRHIFAMLRSGVFYDRADLYLRQGVRDMFLRQHQEIYQALVKHDAAAAWTAANDHLLATAEALHEAHSADQRLLISRRRRDGLDLVSQGKSRL